MFVIVLCEQLKSTSIEFVLYLLWIKCRISGTRPTYSPLNFTREHVAQVTGELVGQVTGEHVGRGTGEHVG